MMRSTLGPMASRTGLYAGLVHLQIFRAEQAEAVVVVEVALVRLEGKEVDLDGIVALGHGLLGLAGVVVRGALGDDVGGPS